ncbi:unnamed protein product, partial [Staurois parvus]
IFDPDFSDPPLLPVSPSYLLIRHIMQRHSAHAQFFFLGECMGSAQGQSALSRQWSGVLHLPRAERKLLLQL